MQNFFRGQNFFHPFGRDENNSALQKMKSVPDENISATLKKKSAHDEKILDTPLGIILYE